MHASAIASRESRMQKLKNKVESKEHKTADDVVARPTHTTVNKSIDLNKDCVSESSTQSETLANINKSKKKNT